MCFANPVASPVPKTRFGPQEIVKRQKKKVISVKFADSLQFKSLGRVLKHPLDLATPTAYAAVVISAKYCACAWNSLAECKASFFSLFSTDAFSL